MNPNLATVRKSEYTVTGLDANRIQLLFVSLAVPSFRPTRVPLCFVLRASSFELSTNILKTDRSRRPTVGATRPGKRSREPSSLFHFMQDIHLTPRELKWSSRCLGSSNACYSPEYQCGMSRSHSQHATYSSWEKRAPSSFAVAVEIFESFLERYFASIRFCPWHAICNDVSSVPVQRCRKLWYAYLLMGWVRQLAD